MIVRIEVTAKHIKAGKVGSQNCPVARAVREHLIPGLYPMVCSDHVRMGVDPGVPAAVCPLPAEAIAFGRQFASMGAVTPFVFALDIPEIFLRNAT